MPSRAYQQWTSTRARALDEIALAHAAVGGTGRGRRYATQQINHAYGVLLASQFQGFCRDLHSESIDHIIAAIAPPPALQPLVRVALTRDRQLDRHNAQPSSIGADFSRLVTKFWDEVDLHEPRSAARRALLESLNHWRNAIAHQDFDPVKLGGTTTLRLARVRRWRDTCQHLAQAFDEVLRRHLQVLTGASPW